MNHAQRYVSSELSHFVGRGKAEPEQYDILLNSILKVGWLTHPPHDLSVPRGVSLDLSKPISTDEAIKYQVVCFCDIPEPDLSIHVGKYSKFGIAFRKEFLIDRGACPVFYVANESPVPVTEVFAPDDFLHRMQAARAKGVVDRALYFDTSVRALFDILAATEALCCEEGERYFKNFPAAEFKKRLATLFALSEAQINSAESSLKGNKQAAKSVRMCADFLLNYVFTYIKCFDAKRVHDDEGNYYMEREWRIAGNVQFDLDDVRRVFLPESWSKRFRADLPSYTGQLSFVG